MDEKCQQAIGYSTKTALLKLRDDIRNVIDEYKHKNRMRYLSFLYRNILIT